ncbi:spore coat protein U domain-containing protein, partial [Yersinia pestis]
VINLNWNYDLCAISLFSLCLGGRFSGTATSTVTVKLTVSNDCVINSAPNVNFGSYALITQFAPVNQNISATCT